MIEILFWSTLVAEAALGACLVASLLRPERRIWPPPQGRSWQFFVIWGLTLFSTAGVVAVGILDWNRFVLGHWLRLPLGAVLMVAGSAFAQWGVLTLGARASSGVRDRFVVAGPYRWTRNPQYVGDIVLLLGWGLLCNSLRTWILCAGGIAWFLLAPFTEEPWLRAQYGSAYEDYRKRTPRFLGRARDPS